MFKNVAKLFNAHIDVLKLSHAHIDFLQLPDNFPFFLARFFLFFGIFCKQMPNKPSRSANYILLENTHKSDKSSHTEFD